MANKLEAEPPGHSKPPEFCEINGQLRCISSLKNVFTSPIFSNRPTAFVTSISINVNTGDT